MRWLAPASAAAAIVGWIVFAVPVARTAAMTTAGPLLGAMGVATSSPTVELGQVHARRTEVDGQTLLYVEGELVNKDKRAQKSPGILVTIKGDDGQPLYAWKSRLAAKTIEASRAAAFQTRLLSPPEKFQSLSVTLINES